MSGRLGIDFGTSNTVVARYDEARQEGVPFHLPDYGRTLSAGGELVSVVPSLIHYAADQRRWVGEQVHQRGLYESARTFRWMKRFIANRSPAKVRVDGREVSHFDAGRDFLSALLAVVEAELNPGDEEVAFTAPVEAYEHYEDWLAQVAEQAGLRRFRLIDEPSAAALGYGAHVQPGNVYLIFDFGGGTLDVAVALIEEEDRARAGRRCRVLGKAGAEVGGRDIDHWLYEELLRLNGRNEADESVRQISRALLVECEAAKEKLSVAERALVTAMNPHTGEVLQAEFTRNRLEELLDEHDLFARLDQTVRRALNAARERGYGEEQLRAVLLVGGSSLVPSVQKTVQRIFGRERVLLSRPLDAVARGAAAFVAGVDFYDHIQHDYGIRHVNAQTGQYEYRLLVRRGTAYPTAAPLARLKVKATYQNQVQLGLAIFELGQAPAGGGSEAVELVFDPSGAARLVKVSPEEADRRAHFWINEASPTFLRAEPPARKGEARFEAEFSIDANKRLLITARDLRTGQLTHRDFPVVKLT